MTDFALSRPLELGESLTQSEVEDVFETNFGYQFRGITLRAPDEGRYLILLANEGEIYDDDLSGGDTFTYLGEGVREKGDQKETPANKALIDAIHDPLPIYLFTSTEGVDAYDYRGIVSVEDYAYVSDGQRMVYKFQIKRLEIPSWERYQQIDANIDQRLQHQPTLTEETTEYTATESSIRSTVFRRKVRAQYDYSCAICGARRFSPDGNPEVEAAHIYPKSEDGADDPRNGLALCRFHHWAFDSGWISIANDHTLLVKHNADRKPPNRTHCSRRRTTSGTDNNCYPPPGVSPRSSTTARLRAGIVSNTRRYGCRLSHRIRLNRLELSITASTERLPHSNQCGLFFNAFGGLNECLSFH